MTNLFSLAQEFGPSEETEERAATLLRLAQLKIVSCGWTRLRFNDGHSFCALGALMSAANESRTNKEVSTFAEKCLDSTANLVMMGPGATPNFRKMIDFNDNYATCEQDILDLFSIAVCLVRLDVDDATRRYIALSQRIAQVRLASK